MRQPSSTTVGWLRESKSKITNHHAGSAYVSAQTTGNKCAQTTEKVTLRPSTGRSSRAHEGYHGHPCHLSLSNRRMDQGTAKHSSCGREDNSARHTAENGALPKEAKHLETRTLTIGGMVARGWCRTSGRKQCGLADPLLCLIPLSPTCNATDIT